MANYYHHTGSVLCRNLERFGCGVKETAAFCCSLLSCVDFVAPFP